MDQAKCWKVAESLHFVNLQSSKQRVKDSFVVPPEGYCERHPTALGQCGCKLAVLLITKESGPGPPLPVLANAEKLIKLESLLVLINWQSHLESTPKS